MASGGRTAGGRRTTVARRVTAVRMMLQEGRQVAAELGTSRAVAGLRPLGGQVPRMVVRAMLLERWGAVGLRQLAAVLRRAE